MSKITKYDADYKEFVSFQESLQEGKKLFYDNKKNFIKICQDKKKISSLQPNILRYILWYSSENICDTIIKNILPQLLVVYQKQHPALFKQTLKHLFKQVLLDPVLIELFIEKLRWADQFLPITSFFGQFELILDGKVQEASQKIKDIYNKILPLYGTLPTEYEKWQIELIKKYVKVDDHKKVDYLLNTLKISENTRDQIFYIFLTNDEMWLDKDGDFFGWKLVNMSAKMTVVYLNFVKEFDYNCIKHFDDATCYILFNTRCQLSFPSIIYKNNKFRNEKVHFCATKNPNFQKFTFLTYMKYTKFELLRPYCTFSQSKFTSIKDELNKFFPRDISGIVIKYLDQDKVCQLKKTDLDELLTPDVNTHN